MPNSTINSQPQKRLIWLHREGPAFEGPPPRSSALAYLQALYGAAWVAEFSSRGGSLALLAAVVRAAARERAATGSPSTDVERMNG